MSPSEAEVDFTQSQEPMIPPVICQGSKAITIHRSSGRFHSLQITTGVLLPVSYNDGPTQPRPGHILVKPLISSSLLNIFLQSNITYQ